jgi:DmsE family decaheme c-type cytochrome
MAPGASETSSFCTASFKNSGDCMGSLRLPALAGLLLTAGVLAPATLAQTDPQAEPVDEASSAAEYSRDGADTCIKCHDDPEVLTLFKTLHGSRADPHSPFAASQLQCEACHGPGGAHSGRVRSGQPRPPILTFGADSTAPAATQNLACLGCHDGAVQDAWHGGEHARGGVACADCHRVHARSDEVRSMDRQAAICLDCHPRQRAELSKPFHHPVEGNAMNCASCHSPHGSTNDFQLQRASLNDTCYTCHAEKRGPYLWEHAPVTEDCSNCHVPHGSSQPALLGMRAPLLCQQCHSQAGHPSIAYGPGNLPGAGQPSSYLVAGSCLNCHSQVHGSNHPSGSKFTR